MERLSTQTLAEQIEETAASEPIEAIVIGKLGGPYGYKDEDPREVATASTSERVLSWEQARPLLDYKWHDGHGSADCHAFYAWTPSRVLFIDEYDGSTRVTYLPRNPIPGKVGFSGDAE